MHELMWLNNCRAKGRGTRFAREYLQCILTSGSAILASKPGARPLYSPMIQLQANRLTQTSVTLRLGGTVVKGVL